jgi:hypothetical protein
VYEGTVAITGTVPAGKADAVEVRAKVVACKDGLCLRPSVVKAK